MNQKLINILETIPKADLRRHFNRATLCGYRRGRRSPDVRQARIFADLLGISLEEFYRRIEE